MKKIKGIVVGLFSHLNKRAAGVHGTLFLIFSITSLVVGNSNRFWMFIIASILFTALQSIIDELRILNNKNK
tara:strand:+ start:515 stop:730 length:216 start_codon:yes stop_codon:yes gene_type:complete